MDFGGGPGDVSLPVMPAGIRGLLATLYEGDGFEARMDRILARDPRALQELAAAVCGPGAEEGQGLPKAMEDSGAARFLSRAVTTRLHRTFPPQDPQAVRLWRRTLLVAACSREVATRVPAFGVHPEEAWMAGLFHDLGAMVLAVMEEGYSAVLAASPLGSPCLLEQERAIYGTDHTRTGSHVAALWGLPPRLRAIIRHHHRSKGPWQDRTGRLLGLVRTAMVLADHVLGEGETKGTQTEVASHLAAWAQRELHLELDPALLAVPVPEAASRTAMNLYEVLDLPLP